MREKVFAHDLAQLFGLNGLVEHFGDSDAKRVARERGIAKRREHDYRGQIDGVIERVLKKIAARTVGHHHIEKNHVVMKFIDVRDGAFSVEKVDVINREMFEGGFQKQMRVLFIINDENFARRGLQETFFHRSD